MFFPLKITFSTPCKCARVGRPICCTSVESVKVPGYLAGVRTRRDGVRLSWHGLVSTVCVFCLPGFGTSCLCAPSIEITNLPPYRSFADLRGSVSGVEPGECRVAVFIYVPPYGWYTKPTCAQPLTVIQSDGSWTTDITTGGVDELATRVAALLVRTNFDADCVLGLPFLPTNLVAQALASAIVTRQHPGVRWLSFSGESWWVKTSSERVGPGPNYFSDSTNNVWVDALGRLHLRITQDAGRWYCAEVVSARTFGFGWYRFVIESRLDNLDTNIVLGLFTWSDDPAWAHREIDFERLCMDTTGRIDGNNFQFVVQPWEMPGHVVRFKVPPQATSSVHTFCWEPGAVRFRSRVGGLAPLSATTNVLDTWVYTLVTPQSGDENVRINLWLYDGMPPGNGHEAEVIVSRFDFSPLAKPFPPVVIRASLIGTNIVLIGTDGVPGGSYLLLSSSELGLPACAWMPLQTNRFDAAGNFTCTVGLAETQPQFRFFLLQLQ